MALDRGSGSRLDREEEERKRREAEGARQADENAARIKAAIAAYQESERRKEQEKPKPYDPTAGRKYPTQPEQPKPYDPTAGAKYPPQEEERPVYRVERARDNAPRHEREEGERRYHESERAAYTRPDTAKPLLSFLPDPPQSRIGLAEPERPDTSTPSLSGSQPRSWDTVGFEEPEREPAPLEYPRTLWTPPTLQTGPPVLRATPNTEALPVVGSILAKTAPVVTQNFWPATNALSEQVGNWWEENPWSPRQWGAALNRDAEQRAADGGNLSSGLLADYLTGNNLEAMQQYFDDDITRQYTEQGRQDRAEDWNFPGGQTLNNLYSAAEERWLDAPGRWLGITPLHEVSQVLSGDYTPSKEGATEFGARPALAYGTAIGGALNQAGNQANPHFVPPQERGLDPSKPFWHPQNVAANLEWFDKTIRQGVEQWDATFAYLNSLPAAQQAQARKGLINMPSGPERTRQAIDAILGQDGQIAQLARQLDAAQAAGDVNTVNQLQPQWYLLTNSSWRDLVDARMNPWAEVVTGWLLDPVGWAVGGAAEGLGATQKAIKARKFAELYNIKPDQAVNQIAKQMERAPELLKIIGGEKPAPRNTAWNLFQLFNRTNESRASLDAQRMFEMAVNAFIPISDVEDARRVLGSLIADGGQSLVRGLAGLRSPAIADTTGGIYRWGAGLIGNAETAKVAPLWQALAEEAPQMRALSGGDFNATEFFAELGEMIYRTTRRANGIADPSELPFGAAKVRVKNLTAGQGALEYLDDAGKVIRTGGAMPLKEARTVARELFTVQKGNLGDLALGAINPQTWARVQKAIMSDMFLALRPANWIRNALSATTMLISEDAFTLVPHGQIVADMTRRFGGVLPWFDANATRETGSGAIDFLARALTRDPNNPVSRLMKSIYSIPYGEHVGGEGWFRAKALYTSLNRALEPAWKQTVDTTFAPALRALNLPPEISREIVGLVKTLGVSGSRADMATQIRQLLNKATVPIDVREAFHLTLDDTTAQGAAQLQDIVNRYGPEQIGAALAEMGRVFDDIRKPYMSVLSQASVQPVVRYTDGVMAEEMALVRDMLVDMGKRAKVPDAKRQAETIAKTLVWGTQKQVGRILNDIANLPGDKRVVDVLNDYFAELQDLSATTRRFVDDLGKTAIEAAPQDAAARWVEKWRGTTQAYTLRGQRAADITDQFRGILAQLSADPNLPYTSRRGWDKILERYMQFDEAAYQQLRAAQETLGGVMETPQTYAAIIDAFRGKVDHSFLTLLDAVKRYPTQENFDLFVNAMQMGENYGRRVAATLSQMQGQVGKEIGKEGYRIGRNNAWRVSWLDATLKHNDAALRQIVENGLTQGTQVPSAKTVAAAAEQIRNAVPQVVQQAQTLTDEAIETVAQQLGVGGEAAAQALRAGDTDAIRAIGDILGLDLDDGADVVTELKQALSNHAGMPTLDVGDVAETMLRHTDELERKLRAALPQLLAGKPNTLTPAQRLRVVDLVDNLLPEYDNVLGQSMRVAEDMAGWMMLNFNDKRNIDTILGMISPFPYFWSRMLPRAVGAALTKPSLVNFYYDAKRGIRLENEQSGIPEVRYGTVPNPLPFGPNRIGLSFLLDAMIPGAMYLNPNPFIEPDEASNDTGRWLLGVMRFSSGMLPATQYAFNAVGDKYWPRKDGLSWNSGFQFSDPVPVWKMIYYDRMRRTGQLPQDAGGVLSGGDEFDYGRIGKGVMLEGQDATANQRLWGVDVVRQAQTGEAALPEQWSGAPALAQEGAQRAGGDRLSSLLFSYFFGMPAYNWTPEEEAAYQAKLARQGAGYDPVTNPWGSQAAVDALDEAQGELGKTYSMYSSLYPQAQALPQGGPADLTTAENRPVPPTYPYRQPFSDTRPGETAARDERNDAIGKVYDTYGPQIEELTTTLDGVNAELATLKGQIDSTPKGDGRDALYAQRDDLYTRKNAADAERDALYEQRDAEIAKIKGDFPSVTEMPVQQEEFIPAQPTGADPTAGTQPQGNIDFYGAYSPQELADVAQDNAERMAKEKYKDQAPNWDNQPQHPKPPGKGASDAQWDAYNAAKDAYQAEADAFYGGVDQYEAAVEAETARLLENPSGLVFGRPTGAPAPEPVSPYTPLRGGSPTLATETTGKVGETDAGPVLMPRAEAERIRAEERAAAAAAKQGGKAGDGTGAGGTGGTGYDAPGRAADFSAYWDAYNKLTDWDAKRKFMAGNPVFEAEYIRWGKKKYGDAWDAWWREPAYPRATGRTSSYYGGGGGGWGGGAADENVERRMDVYIAPREYDRSLMPQASRIEPWRPVDVNLQWLRAGEALRPDRMARWRLRVNQ